MRFGQRRRNFATGIDEELRLIPCQACGQEMAIWDPVEPPAPGFRFAQRCVRCGALVLGLAQSGDSPVNAMLEIDDGRDDYETPGYGGIPLAAAIRAGVK